MSQSETRNLLKFLADKGLTPYKVNDGEESYAVSSINEATDGACSVDEAYVYIKQEDMKVARLYLVQGLCPGELVSDYSTFKAATAESKELLSQSLKTWSDMRMQLA